ncbi:PHB depolymerase family esterase [Zoogloea sp.]|uniref:extracellular catalytic domain type 2 short-chain-length polyhydroxyalkanoate depolymerase n=1 Tax=Zoogloea sp. TaxID=49181 RepID=UPI00260D4533|nr:PHB depolymerase family esterase [Zoogloea sp.]MDD3355120.1 PHB depolymerase family esterase [Zoogloea sp.]
MITDVRKSAALLTLLLGGCMMGQVWAAAASLPALGARKDGVTVSGISSGGFMAVQFQVAYARLVKGAGILAAGPYDCAEGSAVRALIHCMSPGNWVSPPQPADIAPRMASRARLDLIDPPSALADDRVWVLSGGADRTVEPPVVDALLAFYRSWLPAAAIRQVFLPDAGHAMISVDAPEANACATSEPPFINRCGDFDAPGQLLDHLSGDQVPKGASRPEALQSFDQRPFIQGAPVDISLANQGYVYVPERCRAGGCPVHVVFHGCRQGEDQIGRRFVEGAGYNGWAESRGLIVLYPQTVARSGLSYGSWRWVYNPKGCWDWWGYSSADYATRNAPQLQAVRKMVDRLMTVPGR